MTKIGYFCYYSPAWVSVAGFPGFRIFLAYCSGCYDPSDTYYNRYYSQEGRGSYPLYQEQVGEFRVTCCSCEETFVEGSNGFELFSPVVFDEEQGYIMSDDCGMESSQFERLIANAQTR